MRHSRIDYCDAMYEFLYEVRIDIVPLQKAVHGMNRKIESGQSFESCSRFGERCAHSCDNGNSRCFFVRHDRNPFQTR